MKSFQNSRLILLLQSGSLVFLSVLLGILLMKSLWFCSLFTFFVILLFILHIDKQQQKLTEMVIVQKKAIPNLPVNADAASEEIYVAQTI